MNKETKIQLNKYYTINDLVRFADIGLFPCRSREHIKRLLQAGKLKGVEIGVKSLKHWRISGKDVINFINGESNSED